VGELASNLAVGELASNLGEGEPTSNLIVDTTPFRQ
jgi:hypothetical protein